MIKLSRILAYPFLLILAFLAYELFYIEDSTHSIWLIPSVLALASLYVFHNQVDSWWMKKKQPDPDIRIVQTLDSKVKPYRELNIEDKKVLSRKLNVFVHNTEFIGMGLQNIPDDIKFITCVYGFFLGKDQNFKWFKNYNRIAYYKHPFLSPNLPDTIHTSEHHPEDGMFIFSLEQLMPSIEQPEKYYNIVLHEFARAYLSTCTPVIEKETYPLIWNRLEKLGICSKKSIEDIIGLEQINPFPTLLHYYVQFPDIIGRQFPNYLNLLKSHTTHLND